MRLIISRTKWYNTTNVARRRQRIRVARYLWRITSLSGLFSLKSVSFTGVFRRNGVSTPSSSRPSAFFSLLQPLLHPQSPEVDDSLRRHWACVSGKKNLTARTQNRRRCWSWRLVNFKFKNSSKVAHIRQRYVAGVYVFVSFALQLK